MKPLTTGIPDVEGLIQGVYVDKTRQLYQLVRDVRLSDASSPFRMLNTDLTT